MKVPSGIHAMRRGGARREVTERVTLRSEEGPPLEGWALNVSRGGLRVILEEKVVLGQKFDVTIGVELPFAAVNVAFLVPVNAISMRLFFATSVIATLPPASGHERPQRRKPMTSVLISLLCTLPCETPETA